MVGCSARRVCGGCFQAASKSFAACMPCAQFAQMQSRRSRHNMDYALFLEPRLLRFGRN